MKSKYEIFIDSDVFADHLAFKPSKVSTESKLIKTIRLFSSYTSVLNVSEVLAACDNKRTSDKAMKTFYGISVLGIPYRYAESVADILRFIKKKALQTATVMPL
ncbi:MAG TPA: hypothetical protein VK004_04560 [Ignavibacteria bacterium]|nr:hypothetical protein [Ignavibacteria bacterium]